MIDQLQPSRVLVTYQFGNERWLNELEKQGVTSTSFPPDPAYIAFEIGRSVVGLDGAGSAEFETDCEHPVIDLLPEQKAITDKGATMRLGAYECALEPGSRAHEEYGEAAVFERHRHRYEFNKSYEKAYQDAGVVFSGRWPEKGLVEILELPDHPWFVGCQFHPEFRSRPGKPHPLFSGFVRAARRYSGGGDTASGGDEAESNDVSDRERAGGLA